MTGETLLSVPITTLASDVAALVRPDITAATSASVAATAAADAATAAAAAATAATDRATATTAIAAAAADAVSADAAAAVSAASASAVSATASASSASAAAAWQTVLYGGRLVDVAAILGGPPSGASSAAQVTAMRTAITTATTTPGSVIALCAGAWDFTNASATFAVPTKTLLIGAGMDRTVVTWDDSTCSFNLFTAASGGPTDITFQDFTTVGGWVAHGIHSGGSGGYPILPSGVDHLRFLRVGAKFSRTYGITARNCTDVSAESCDIRYCVQSGIDFSGCTLMSFTDNTIEHCDDDAIGAHSQIFDPWGVRRNIIITGNRIFDCQGIKVGAPRQAIIANNIIDCCRAQGISFFEVVPSGGAIEGLSAADIVVITGNVITNVIDRTTIDNINNGATGILISGAAARAGTLPAVPGENRTDTAAIIDATTYFGSNIDGSSTATPVSRGFIVTGNTIARTLPACDGSVTATGGTGTTYSHYSDYGFQDPVGGGLMFTRSGWVNPALAESALRPQGIAVGGRVHDVMISGNYFRGLAQAVLIGPGRLFDIVVAGNEIIDCKSIGAVLINTNGGGSGVTPACRVYVLDNLIDVDPGQTHPNRLPNGKWNLVSAPHYPAGVWIQSGSGVVIQRNRFRNCITPVSNNSGGIMEASDNWLEFDPVTGTGIGGSTIFGKTLQIDGDPGSSTYGSVLSVPVDESTALPTTGIYGIGAFVRKQLPTTDGNGYVLTGWTRMTGGAGQVLGVDWEPVFDSRSSSDATALPVAGASNGQVTAIAVSGIPGELQIWNNGTNTMPAVTIAAPGGGGVQATATIDQIIGEISGTLTGTSYAPAPASSTLMFVQGGSSYVAGATLTATGTIWVVPFAGTVDATNSLGAVTQFVVTNIGTASALPPTALTFTSSGTGSGFEVAAPLFHVAHIAPVNSGYYPNGTPTATIAGLGGGGFATVMMGQSVYADTTGLHIPITQAGTSYANDGLAAAGGIAVGGVYRNGSALQIRVT